MTWSTAAAVRLFGAGKRIYTRKWQFLGFFALVFFTNVVSLAKLDLLPNPVLSAAAERAPTVTLATSTSPTTSPEDPTKIEIPTIGLSATIANPTTTSLEALDAYLLKGAARYPTSARLNEAGNVVLFAHSSYLPVVGNQAYKTFDGIQKLVAGDVITVYSAGAAYTYRVRGVAKESAATGSGIDLAVAGKVLTLVTCNSFATKSDRFVVTADFVESHSLTS